MSRMIVLILIAFETCLWYYSRSIVCSYDYIQLFFNCCLIFINFSAKITRMQIDIQNFNEGNLQNFFFQPITNKALEEKETKEILTKWGLIDTLKIGSFRYNQSFQDYDARRFFVDLFNNPNVRFVMENIKFQQEAIVDVEFDKLRCHELTMDIFDKLEKEDIVKKGYICKIFSDYYEGIEICDKLRECLLIEQGQSFCSFNQSQRSQFIFRLFKLLVVGGSFNQYQDTIQPYLDWTKKMYKNVVSVRKRPQISQIFIQSLCYEINSIDGGKGYKKGFHPQKVLYVIINPSIRTVHIIANDWKKFW